MQPYFFPYIGYFQLINAVDEFIVYDNIEYSKKGWINRNRILLNGKDVFISIPLKKESDYLNVDKRSLSEDWTVQRKHILNKIEGAYRKAPYFKTVYPVIEAAILFEENNLFQFIFHSLQLTREYLGISTELIISSTIPVDHKLKAEEKVIGICKARNASTYINAIGGVKLYNTERFRQENIYLHFLKTGNIHYIQFNDSFLPELSIVDVMMFNDRKAITNALNLYELK
jgi:hypothetical protein